METRLLQLCFFDANVAQVFDKNHSKLLRGLQFSSMFQVLPTVGECFSSFKVKKKKKKVTYEVNGAVSSRRWRQILEGNAKNTRSEMFSTALEWPL